MKKSTTLKKSGRSIILLIAILPLLIIGSCQKEDSIILNDEVVTEADSPQLKSADVSDYLLELIQSIEKMVTDGLISKGNANALISKIENAIKNLEKGNDNAAEGQLNAIINQIESLEEDGTISEELGEELILQTEVAINKIEGKTYVPDDNFEQALIDLGYDKAPLDDYVPTANIAIVSHLSVSYKGISDLTGIQDFTSLAILDCRYNQLTSLDVSTNTSLEYLNFSYNQITGIDVSNCSDLAVLGCSYNQLSSLDISNNSVLTTLYSNVNQLTSLDVSNNIALTVLQVNWNQLTELNLSNCIALTEFWCDHNQLTSLNVSVNASLSFLVCDRNQLTYLDLSSNDALSYLRCRVNELTGLNISNNGVLDLLDCRSNKLTCIQVKDINNLPTEYYIDPDVSFSEECEISPYETFIDPRDGNEYKIVTIGDQIWMAENLRATIFNDGTEIPMISDNTEWVALKTPGFCWYNNNYESNGNTYGALYNWYAINTGKLAPEGWHVATEAEWSYLVNSNGGFLVAGGPLKESGTSHWLSPNTGATNETGFTALPGGMRNYEGAFGYQTTVGYFHTATEGTTYDSNTIVMYNNNPYSIIGFAPKILGLSVRCVKD